MGGSLVIPVPPPHTTFLVRQEAATSLGQVLIVREGGTGITIACHITQRIGGLRPIPTTLIITLAIHHCHHYQVAVGKCPP